MKWLWILFAILFIFLAASYFYAQFHKDKETVIAPNPFPAINKPLEWWEMK